MMLLEDLRSPSRSLDFERLMKLPTSEFERRPVVGRAGDSFDILLATVDAFSHRQVRPWEGLKLEDRFSETMACQASGGREALFKDKSPLGKVSSRDTFDS